MTTEVLKKEDLLFEEQVKLTRIVDYGYSWEKFARGEDPIPAAGIKFDIHFEGDVIGETISGKIEGVDYLTVRADRRLFLNLHATITTWDGVNIYVCEHGINANGKLNLAMDFHTTDPRYDWINHKHVWGIGTVDFTTGEVHIKGYKN